MSLKRLDAILMESMPLALRRARRSGLYLLPNGIGALFPTCFNEGSTRVHIAQGECANCGGFDRKPKGWGSIHILQRGATTRDVLALTDNQTRLLIDSVPDQAAYEGYPVVVDITLKDHRVTSLKSRPPQKHEEVHALLPADAQRQLELIIAHFFRGHLRGPLPIFWALGN